MSAEKKVKMTGRVVRLELSKTDVFHRTLIVGLDSNPLCLLKMPWEDDKPQPFTFGQELTVTLEWQKNA